MNVIPTSPGGYNLDRTNQKNTPSAKAYTEEDKRLLEETIEDKDQAGQKH